MQAKVLRVLVVGLLLVVPILTRPSVAVADMVAIHSDLTLVGEPRVVSSVPTEVTFVVTNIGGGPETVAQPHLVRLDGGIRIPLTITTYEVDGLAHGRFDELTLAAGASMRVRATFSGLEDRGERSWELALSFRGMARPTSVTIRRA